MTELTLDSTASKLTIRTRTVGLLARLGHDLEISAADLSAQVRLAGDAWSAELQVPVAGLRVAGVLRGAKLDTAGLSARDRQEIERRMHGEVLGGTATIHVRASGASRERAEVRLELASGSASLGARLSTSENGGAIKVAGSCQVSLAALGIREVKAPLGAFKVRDELDVLFDFTLRPADRAG